MSPRKAGKEVLYLVTCIKITITNNKFIEIEKKEKGT